MSLISLISNIFKVRRDGKLSTEQINDLQQKRLEDIVKYAIENSKFYRDYYGDHGISIKNVAGINIKDLPTINKKMMMDNFDDFVTDSALKHHDLEAFISDPGNRRKKYRSKYQVIHTSGSTGRVGIFVYGEKDWDWLKGIAINRVSKSKLFPPKQEKAVFIGAVDGKYAGISLASDAPKFLLDIMELDINKPLSELQAKLNKFKPDVITGYSSGVYCLAKEKLEGLFDVRPSRVLCSADILQPNMRKTIKDAFSIEPINFYASSESVGMAAECDAHNGMHIFTDCHVFEILNDKNEPVAENEAGKLILTNLYNFTQPLIRYEMNDQLIRSGDTCSCGSPFPKIKSVAGRQEEFLWLKKADGSRDFLHPVVFGEFFVPGLKKLQIKQDSPQSFTMSCVVDGDIATIAGSVHERINTILQSKGFGDEITYKVNFLDDILNDKKTGKFKMILPLKWD